MNHAVQHVRRNVKTFRARPLRCALRTRRDKLKGLLHMPNLAGVWGLLHMPNLAGVGKVDVHSSGELQARLGEAVLDGLAQPLHRLTLAACDAAA